MDELDKLAEKYDAIEQDEVQEQSEPVAEKPSEPEFIEPTEAGKERAEALLKISEKLFNLTVEDRLALTGEDIEEGRESLGPVLEKYNVQGEGKFQYQEEVTAGFFIGRLVKKVVSGLRTLRKMDAEARKQKQKQNNQEAINDGEERERRATQPAQVDNGSERNGEKSDVEKEGWSSESF